MASVWNGVWKLSVYLEQLLRVSGRIIFANLRIRKFDDVSVEIGARTVVWKAEERDFGVVECGVADVA